MNLPSNEKRNIIDEILNIIYSQVKISYLKMKISRSIIKALTFIT